MPVNFRLWNVATVWAVAILALCAPPVSAIAEAVGAPTTVLLATDPLANSCFGGGSGDHDDPRPLLAALVSPRMVYSLLEWPRMQAEAQALGFRVQVWQDPRVPPAEWAMALASPALVRWEGPAPAPLPRDCLAQWGAVDHWPLTRVISGQLVHPWPIWGVMSTEAWRASLLNRLHGLSAASPQRGSD